MQEGNLTELIEVLEYFMPLRELADMDLFTWRALWIISRDALLFGAIGWVIAWAWERRGLKKLAEREAFYSDVNVESSERRLEGEGFESAQSDIIEGSMVLSHDYFRGFTIFLARIFGGQIRHYDRLFDRCRREAIVRLKENAAGQGMSRIVNLKIVPTAIKRNGPATVEVVVYGTGIYD